MILYLIFHFKDLHHSFYGKLLISWNFFLFKSFEKFKSKMDHETKWTVYMGTFIFSWQSKTELKISESFLHFNATFLPTFSCMIQDCAKLCTSETLVVSLCIWWCLFPKSNITIIQQQFLCFCCCINYWFHFPFFLLLSFVKKIILPCFCLSIC